jgi:phospholipase C
MVPALARRWTRDKDSDVDCARNEPFLARDRKDLDMRKPITRVALIGAGLSLVALGAAPLAAGGATAASEHNLSTASPIKHLVVIFQENVSFDHYFGTYPNAANTSGQPFLPAPHTKPVNGLTQELLTANPNAANPQRLDPAVTQDVLTCSQGHGYTEEQSAFDLGNMDKFVEETGTTGTGPTGAPCVATDVMNYYDGNTVTGYWNYAQHFSMSDNSFGSTFGPSSVGAINLVSGDTGGVTRAIRGGAGPADVVADGRGGFSMLGDPQPFYDDCSRRDAVALSGTNIGDQLNAAGRSWGFFQGGFRPDAPYAGPPDTTLSYDPEASAQAKVQVKCTLAKHNIGAALDPNGLWGTRADYIPHHEPFQYYASTANPHHLAPASLTAIGTDTSTPGMFDTANHQYDMSDFDDLVAAIHDGSVPPSNLPAVSILKAPAYQDGHAAYSDPIDEQTFVVNEINALEQLPTWSSTAVIVAYDDSDGWYDHAYSGVHNPSQTTADTLTGAGSCGQGDSLAGQQGRCGYGPRLPLLVISPWARANYVSHRLTDQSSILKFVEGNWGLGRIRGSFANIAGSLKPMFDFDGAGDNPALLLDPATGQPL